MAAVYMTHPQTPDYVGPLDATVDPSQIDEWKSAGWIIGTGSDKEAGAVMPTVPALSEQIVKRGKGRPKKV
jgi:hypothetical protein